MKKITIEGWMRKHYTVGFGCKNVIFIELWKRKGIKKEWCPDDWTSPRSGSSWRCRNDHFLCPWYPQAGGE